MMKVLGLAVVAVLLSALAWVYFVGVTPPLTEVSRPLTLPTAHS